jgi:hypothetical protein
MKTLHFIIKALHFIIKEGNLYWIQNMPEEPKNLPGLPIWETDREIYNRDLQQAKDNAILVENQDYAHALIWREHTDGNLLWKPKPDTIYTLTGEYKVEVKTNYIPITRGFSFQLEGEDNIRPAHLVKDGIVYRYAGKVVLISLESKKEERHIIKTANVILSEVFTGELSNKDYREVIKAMHDYAQQFTPVKPYNT